MVLAIGREQWGESILDFVAAYKLSIINSYLKKKEERLVAFKSSNTRTQIDYFLIRLDIRRVCKNCKVVLSA